MDFKKLKKTFLWAAVCILIGEFAFGAFVILTGFWDIHIGKIQLTFLMLAAFLFIGVNNFLRIEHGNQAVRGLARLSFGANAVGLLLGILLVWEALPTVEYVRRTIPTYYGLGMDREIAVMSVFVKLALVALSLGAAGFWTSNVLSIRETVKPVKPLKITAVVCEVYTCAYAIVLTLIGYENLRYDEYLLKWSQLSGLAGLAFVVTALAAWIISRTTGKKQIAKAGGETTDAAIREMREKEVRERLAAEKEKERVAALPPLQSDDMPPTVARDNELKIETTISKKELEGDMQEEIEVKTTEDSGQE